MLSPLPWTLNLDGAQCTRVPAQVEADPQVVSTVQQWAVSPYAILASHTRKWGPVLAALPPLQLPANAPGKLGKMAQVGHAGDLDGALAAGFALAQLQLLSRGLSQ